VFAGDLMHTPLQTRYPEPIRTGAPASALTQPRRGRRGSGFSRSMPIPIGSFSRRISPVRSAAGSDTRAPTIGSSFATREHERSTWARPRYSPCQYGAHDLFIAASLDVLIVAREG
jgi:hypothetical protein